jgi:hypothetical protein
MALKPEHQPALIHDQRVRRLQQLASDLARRSIRPKSNGASCGILRATPPKCRTLCLQTIRRPDGVLAGSDAESCEPLPNVLSSGDAAPPLNSSESHCAGESTGAFFSYDPGGGC